MKKIFIPAIAKTFTHTFKDNRTTFYVKFPYENEDEFHTWCEQNNIGFTKENRQDITKSDCAVFTDISNKSVFI